MKNHSYLQRFGEVELAVRRQGKGVQVALDARPINML